MPLESQAITARCILRIVNQRVEVSLTADVIVEPEVDAPATHDVVSFTISDENKLGVLLNWSTANNDVKVTVLVGSALGTHRRERQLRLEAHSSIFCSHFFVSWIWAAFPGGSGAERRKLSAIGASGCDVSSSLNRGFEVGQIRRTGA